jgi:hypothetical protein
MYKPQFPYTGNQAIISSGRVVHHSYDDFIFMFGKKGVAISSPATFTVDANEKTIIASPKIELGYQAIKSGEPVLLGKSTVTQLGFLLDAIKNVSDALNKLSAEEPETAIAAIKQTTTVLTNTVDTVKKALNSSICLSSNTFTK